MIVYPIQSRIVKPGDSIIDAFSEALSKSHVRLRIGDIVAVSSKIVGISEKRVKDLGLVKPTKKAKHISDKYSMTATFAQTVIDEADLVIGGVKGALLTIKSGDAVPNAGIDRKNAPQGSVVMWPEHPDESARLLRNSIRKKYGRRVGVIVVDSRVTPMRLGTVGFAIGSSGILPVDDVRGRTDLAGRAIEITFRAVADGLAATAQVVMGESSEKNPFVIIRGAPVRFQSNDGIRETKLAPSQCLYMSKIIRSRS